MQKALFEKYFVLSNVQKKELETLSAAWQSFDAISEKTLKALIYRYKNKPAQQVLFLKLIEAGVDNDNLAELARSWVAPVFPVTGDDLMAKGIPAGPALGQKMKELEDQWIENGFSF